MGIRAYLDTILMTLPVTAICRVHLLMARKLIENNLFFVSSRTQSSASRPDDDEPHITTLSKSDVVLTFQLEVSIVN